MSKIGLGVLLFLAQLGSAAEPSPLQRLQAKVAVEPVPLLTASQLAGKYSHPTKELAPGLSGNDLYLFADGTFIYDEWADIQPLTIYDKGNWKVENGTIVLISDKDITWNPGAERSYIVIRRPRHQSEILLLGASQALGRFEEAAKDQPELELMIRAKEREVLIKSPGSAARIKKKLIQNAWNPAYFTKK